MKAPWHAAGQACAFRDEFAKRELLAAGLEKPAGPAD
jgi:hypothetical protein